MAGESSRNNGKKGGRPKGYNALEAEMKRQRLAEMLGKSWEPIVQKAIDDALNGDKSAREWLTDNGYGKVKDSLEVVDPDGALKTIIIQKGVTKKKNGKNSND